MEDVCLVCAEPLVYTAFGPCGHKDACSKCVLRLRTVLKDTRCVTCRQTCASVYVTRSMGSYTPTLTADQFAELPAKVEQKRVFQLAVAEAYFDDEHHYRQMKALCSFSHPSLTDSNGRLIQCSSLQSLSSKIFVALGKRFCPLCLEGRKVFLGEQLLYAPRELDAHTRRGDTEGALAESGFRGHPECRFCERHFYGENELYTHMHTQHEQCFLCRRTDPSKHVYYRDYADLENHFAQEHFPCQQPSCLEQKFVVFNSLQELRQHTVREHGEMLSKADRRAAAVVPVDFSFRQRDAGARGGRERGEASGAGPAPRPRGVTIGGGAGGTGARFGRRSGSVDDLAAAVQASLRTSEGAASESEQPPPASLDREADFPAFGAPSVTAAVAAAAGPSARWAGAVGGAGGGAALGPDQFPSLAPVGRAARRRQQDAERALREEVSMAARLAARNSVRVLNAGAGRAAAGGPGPGGRAVPGLPAASDSASASGAAFPSLPPAPQRAPPAAAARGKAAAQPSRAALQEQFREDEGWRLLSRDEQDAQLMAGLRASRMTHLPSSQSLPAREAAGAGGGAAQPGEGASASAAAPVSDKRAQRVRAAHKALTAKIRERVAPEDFESFRAESGAWIKGDISTADYAMAMVALGLAELAPELAATCPDAERGKELVRAIGPAKKAHRRAQGNWVPPEVLEMELRDAPPTPAPAPAPVPAPAASGDTAFPSLGSASRSQGAGPSTSSATPLSASKKGKGSKKSLASFYDETSKKAQAAAWDKNRKAPALQGQWKKNGLSLAEKERVMQDAWGR